MSAARLTRLGRYVVPLQEPEAVRHLVRHHLVAHDVRERVGGWLASGSIALGLERLAPPVLDAAFRSHSSDDPWSEEIRHEVACLLEDAGLTVEPPSLYLVDTAPASAAEPSGVAFCFERASIPARGAPAIVIKVRPLEAGRSDLRRELEALESIRALLPPELQRTLPEPIGHRRVGSAEILATTCLAGRPIYLDLHNRLRTDGRAEHHLRAAVSWLSTFQNTLTGRGQADAPVRSHGDFWARNVLLDDDRVVGVVDWEHASHQEPPTADLFHFLVTFGLAVRWTPFRRTDPLVAFRRTFIDRTRVSRAVRRSLEAYAQSRAVGLDLLEGHFLRRLADAHGAKTPHLTSGVRQAATRMMDDADETVFST